MLLRELQKVMNFGQMGYEYLKEYLGLLDEVREILNDGLDNLDLTDSQVLKEFINDFSLLVFTQILDEEIPWEESTLSNMTLEELHDCLDEVKQSLEGYIDDLESDTEDCKNEEEFILESRLMVLKGNKSMLEIESKGYISPERGSSDQVYLELIIDSNVVAVGEISQSYGDYIIEDHGGAIAVHGDEMWVNLKDLTRELEEFAELNVNQITQIRNAIYNVF